MSHWAHLNIWPDEIIELQREILHHHPELQERFKNHPAGEWEIKLAETAVYCDVILDGTYMPEEIQKLAAILTRKLIERRKDNRGLLIVADLPPNFKQ
jgi:hypothetical protein